MSKSKVFVLVLISFVGGIFLYSMLKTPPIIIGGVFSFVIFKFAEAYRKRNTEEWKEIIIFGICILAFGIGLWRSSTVFNRAASPEIVNLSDMITDFSGRITEEPDVRMDTIYYVLDSANYGKILIKSSLYPQYSYGDFLEFRGNIEKPENFEDFDYKNYLAKSDIFLVSRNPKIIKSTPESGIEFFSYLLGFKKLFVENINKILAEPYSAYLNALLVGAKQTLPRDLLDAFSKTGTSHIIAISGYNISLISVALFNFLAYLLIPRRLNFWIVAVAIVAFTFISGASASVVRAAVMGGLLLIARANDRLYNVTPALVFAGAIMLFLNPRLLRFDAGFQLSFLSTLGLVYISPYFNRWLSKIPDNFSFRTNLAATFGAQAATLPILLLSFGWVSPIAPLANILILPAVPPAMLFGFLLGLTGFLSSAIAMVIAAPTWLLLSYQLFIVKILSQI